MSDIERMKSEAITELAGAGTVAELEDARVKHLGRSAPLVLMLRDVGKMAPEERSRVGKEANAARQELERLANERADLLEAQELQVQLLNDRVDVTLPGRTMPQGSLHILTQTRRLVEDAFMALGYRVVDGPEIDSTWYNFTALNTPEGHPARSASDTFYIDDTTLLRTQTSPVQIRAMQTSPPPLYVISPGRVYRRDRIDATHSDMFHQVEGLAVDEGLTLADLKGTLQAFCRTIFGADREIRLRTHFFPFTEPSVEADVSCYLCGGSGEPAADDEGFDKCRLCRGVGWIELMGAGMVDPNVFAHVEGYSKPGLSGFAFGAGIDRIAMLRHSFPDLRMLFDNDVRFLAQFAGR